MHKHMGLLNMVTRSKVESTAIVEWVPCLNHLDTIPWFHPEPPPQSEEEEEQEQIPQEVGQGAGQPTRGLTPLSHSNSASGAARRGYNQLKK